MSSTWSLGPPSLDTRRDGIVPSSHSPPFCLGAVPPPHFPSPSGHCSCPGPTSALAWLALLADIDECTDSDTCGDARCKNLPGSYSCLCDKGYTYSSKEKTCQGIRATATQVTSLFDAWPGTHVGHCLNVDHHCFIGSNHWSGVPGSHCTREGWENVRTSSEGLCTFNGEDP